MAGRDEEAREYGRRSALVLDDLGYIFPPFSRLPAAEANLLLGDTAAAERELPATWRIGTEGGSGRQAEAAALGLACDEGRWEEAAQWRARAENAGARKGMTLLWPGRLAVEARIATQAGETASALRTAHDVVTEADRTSALNHQAWIRLVLAEVLRKPDRATVADSAVAEAIRLFEAKGNVAAAAPLQTAAGSIG